MLRARSGYKVFQSANYLFLSLLALLCLIPMVHVVSVSFSSAPAVAAHEVTFWPIGPTLFSYKKALGSPELYHSALVSVERILLSFVIGLTITCMAAYVLSKGEGRDGIGGYKFFVGFFVFAMLFNGGMIPMYLVVTKIGLYDSIWALVLPGAVNIFNLILVMNFFKALPKELEEAAFMDGANHWTVFNKLFLPLSIPVLATVGLFLIVNDWNEWLAGSIYMKPNHVPLATYLKSIISMPEINSNNVKVLAQTNFQALMSAQIVIGAVPILVIYPVLQRFFAAGLVIGAVKE
ncbi:carbohydrate ABC transporter permease [Paenibacillus andongensis]|uniref:carbohydrate ABC transporter permease n=1 Tax=Paenibacillus andongensis TaxID=2975482 RepID=UPI0021BB70B9|nr:carbohydrate ABC transporter permease [Paenibacillus andongensis]